MGNYNQIIRGEYVATPIRNAFNGKTAYWLSKRNYTLAIYMFTVDGYNMTKKEIEERLSEKGFREYIPMFEEKCKRPFNQSVFSEEWNKINT